MCVRISAYFLSKVLDSKFPGLLKVLYIDSVVETLHPAPGSSSSIVMLMFTKTSLLMLIHSTVSVHCRRSEISFSSSIFLCLFPLPPPKKSCYSNGCLFYHITMLLDINCHQKIFHLCTISLGVNIKSSLMNYVFFHFNLSLTVNANVREFIL